MYDDSFADLITAAVKHKPAVALDSATPKDNFALDAAFVYMDASNKIHAISVMNEWLETDDLDENETLSDRLLNMCVGVACDDAIDGELTDEQQESLEMVLDAAHDWLMAQGVEEDDVKALLDDWCADTANNVRDYLISTLPEGEDTIINYVFDDVAMDATYKKIMAVRKGKKVRINKRVAGRVRLSAKQKMGLKKAQRRSHNALATIHRKKSMFVRGKTGLDKPHQAKKF